jgi:hypothetical protein
MSSGPVQPQRPEWEQFQQWQREQAAAAHVMPPRAVQAPRRPGSPRGTSTTAAVVSALIAALAVVAVVVLLVVTHKSAVYTQGKADAANNPFGYYADSSESSAARVEDATAQCLAWSTVQYINGFDANPIEEFYQDHSKAELADYCNGWAHGVPVHSN